MALQLSITEVQALALDASSLAAGKKLGSRAPWKQVGRSDDALWGECQGSTLYLTQVALIDRASKCTCPSRKFPCKHALGLLFLAAASPDVFAALPEPAWVTDWQKKRGAAQQKKQARVEAVAAAPMDEAAQAKRAAKRHQSILAGLDQLDAWMNDLVRNGLGRLAGESFSFWDAEARRLVDAQAGGLASRVRQMGARVGAASDWPPRALDDLGALSLLTRAYRRMGELDPAVAADVRRLVGLTLDQAEVLAHGDVTRDEWTVLTDVVEEDDRVRSQRAWLRGRASGRDALVLQFAAGTARFAEALAAGTRFRAELAFWPSAHPTRALVVERLGAPEAALDPPEGLDVEGAMGRYAEHLGKLPFLDRDLLVLARVTAEAGDGARLVDERRRALPLRGANDRLLALSGGHPIAVAGEWDGYTLTPLTAWSDGRLIPVATRPS